VDEDAPRFQEPVFHEALYGPERATGPVTLQAWAEPLPGRSCAAVYVSAESRHPTGVRLVLEYRDPATGTFHPATLSTQGGPVRLFASPLPRTLRLLWEHASDLPGLRADATLRLRALVGDTEVGSRDLQVPLAPEPHFTQVPLEHPTGEAPMAVRVGDFNGDGRADIAAANAASANVAVFLNTEEGMPEHRVLFTPVPASVELLVSADLDGDGRLDLVTGGRGAAGAFVLLGRGDGHFAPGRDLLMEDVLDALELADVDGDGKGDLVALSVQSSRYHVARGQGDGRFLPARSFEAPREARWLGVGDFDGDRRVDLAFVSPGQGGRATFALGLGDGTFQRAGEYTCPFLDAVGAGDVVGDGRAELLLTCREARNDAVPGFIRALTPEGREAVRSRELPAPSTEIYSRILPADVSGDGRPDLLLASPWSGPFSDGYLRVMLGREDGSFELVQSVGLHSPLDVALGDLNGDRVTDVAVAGGPTHYSIGRVERVLGKGGGMFDKARSLQVDRPIHDALAADWDGDGRADLLVAQDALSFRAGRGDGSFRPARELWLPVPPRKLAAADFNRDGRNEVLVLDAEGSVQTYDFRDGWLVPGARVGQVPFAVDISAADFNGDAIPDVLVSRGEGQGPVLLLSEQGTFRLVVPPVTEQTWSFAAAGDANGDGKQDLLVGGSKLLLGDGQGGFTPSSLELPPSGVAQVSDFTGDGRTDILTHECQLLLGLGRGIFLEGPRLEGHACNRMDVGDYDGDGRLEVMSSSGYAETGEALAWRVDARGGFQLLGSLHPRSYARSLRSWAADFDGDGAEDPVIYRRYLYESGLQSDLAIGLTRPCATCLPPSLTGASRTCR
jgi:hypothetical protein